MKLHQIQEPQINLQPNQLQIWKRTEPLSDGYAYHDIGLTDRVLDWKVNPDPKFVFRRDITTKSSVEITTINSPSVFSISENVPESQIDFRSYACNIVQKTWVCSRSTTPFCVFFSGSVPASTKMHVKTINFSPVLSQASDKRLFNIKCRGKILVNSTRSALDIA